MEQVPTSDTGLSLEQLLDQFSECKDCHKAILPTCCRVCWNCKAKLCNTCEVPCSRCPRVLCKSCTQEGTCSDCHKQICGACKLVCTGCKTSLCGNCKVSCGQCKRQGCARCLALQSCGLCGRLHCLACRSSCSRCELSVCADYCQRRCEFCKGLYCLNCIGQCQCHEWLLECPVHLQHVGLNKRRLSVWASNPQDEKPFVVRGLTEFQHGIHRYNVLIEKLQPDCGGYAFGLCALSDFQAWQKGDIDIPHLTKQLLGVSANGVRLSSKIVGLHTRLVEGQTYNVHIDQITNKLQIRGAGTDVNASLDPTQVYLPLFTRCHGTFMLTVQHGL